ncbi:tryptophanyl-tRNA synthetase [Nadsonia fulvescens var. elongata DSM 6958]|uniref:tryptophan--tRNA ligase n=1 Tax=Nadsonia fulvescens var. elongata DSM 6958 TaxID=857566 RepID=A0A1E3PI03_9ASCO|nr:tryptophanyl-tRNA synthetase [Nadsonia fulvescens var. elongata DSM 6958]
MAARTVLNLSKPILDTILPPHSTAFSGIQPTGVFHLGNYLGAVRNVADLSHQVQLSDSGDKVPETPELFFSVVDLHAITVPQVPATLKANRVGALASLLASGVDPKRCSVFYQSSVPEHSQLNWLLSSITSMGYLNRMTQWKSKLGLGASQEDVWSSESMLGKLRLGLFAYPVLMAGDIMLYRTTHVPVGEDQSQHLELTRHLITLFNKTYCSSPSTSQYAFPIPKTLLTQTKKIRSLRDPLKKMSKSDSDPASCIYITDAPEAIQSKIRRAVTDSINGEPFLYDPARRPGVSNLIELCAGIQRVSTSDVEAALSSFRNHKQLKDYASEVLVNELKPVRDQYTRLMADTGYLDQLASVGTARAREVAQKNLADIHKVMGLA